MGNFSRNTFDKMNQYVNVRLQQGVPLLDADWNEQDDIRKYERQAFIRDFIGDGVPPGSDAFLIRQAGDNGGENDFEIVGGEGTDDDTKRCLVDGWDVFNPQSLKYQDQLLYDNDDLAKEWDVDVLPELQAPDEERTDTVYLDIWEVEVDVNEDETLKDQNIGVETCVRLKRVWAVRVEEDSSNPPSEAPQGHVFYPLAHLKRPQNEATITDDQITDLRTTAGSKHEPNTNSLTLAGSQPFESEWQERSANNNDWIDVCVGFQAKMVSVIAQPADDQENDTGNQYTQISPAPLAEDLTSTDITCFLITNDKVRVKIKDVKVKVRFKVYAW